MKCKYSDPTCPCQDGDACHYEGEKPMKPVHLFAERDALLLRSERAEEEVNKLNELVARYQCNRQSPGQSPRRGAEAMSIFCSMKGIGDDFDSKPGHRPLRYRGSHIFPSVKDEHAGSIDLAFIARHISRDRKDRRSENSPLHPWLRFGLSRENGGAGFTVILSRKQVADLAEQLNWFLKESEPK